MTVGELQQRMTNAEFVAWGVYEKIRLEEEKVAGLAATAAAKLDAKA